MYGRLYYILFLIYILILTSCGQGSVPAREETEEIHEASVTMDIPLPDKVPYKVYVQTNKYCLSLYEPEAGRYAGAYILSDSTVSEIKDFEALAGEHTIYLYDMKIGDVFPISWLLSCMSNMRTPYFVINPQNGYDPFDIDALAELADEIGRFYIPVFVDLYPNADLSLYDPEEYKAFFREAYEVFKNRASNAAVVFSIAHTTSGLAYLYYPGNDYVDWVGINIQIGVDESEEDILKNIDNIYYRFQKDKPLMISSCAVSHISGKNHVYRTESAAAMLSGFYSRILKRYPRIKGMNYININAIESGPAFSNQKWTGDNYLITDEKLLLGVYKSIVEDSGFVGAIDYQSHKDYSSEYFVSPFYAYLYENEMYINANTVSYDLNLKGFSSYDNEKMIIDGETCYKLSLLEKNRLKKINVDEEERIIYMDEP